MIIEIDFNSDEAIYVQLMNQIIMGIAVALAKGCCRNVSRSEVHDLIDEIYDEYEIDN